MDPTSQALLMLCKELQALRDDVYNATLIEYGAAFASGAITEGSTLITCPLSPLKRHSRRRSTPTGRKRRSWST